MPNDILTGTPPGTVENPGMVDVSTKLTNSAQSAESGGGSPSASPDKPESLQDVLADEMRKGREEAEKPDTKPEEKPEAKAKPDAEEPEKKPEPAPKEPVKDEAKAPAPKPQQEGREQSSSEDDRSAPPARISEDAKPQWRNTPRAVKAEFHRLDAEIQRITQESGEAMRLHSEVKEFDDLAKRNGTTIAAALKNYVGIENLIRQDFGKGIAEIAKNNGMHPGQPIGAILRAFNVTPAQLAQAAAQNPQAFTPQPQAPRDPMVAQIAEQQRAILQRFEQQDQSARMTQAAQAVANWAKDKPDYQTLEPYIADFLKSGMIERRYGNGLSDVQRLDAAYRMAGGNAGSIVPQNSEPAPDHQNAPPSAVGDPGKKSVRGAPADGMTPKTEESYTDIKDLLRKELRRMG